MDDLAAHTDSYFLKTKAIVSRFGDREATYAVYAPAGHLHPAAGDRVS